MKDYIRFWIKKMCLVLLLILNLLIIIYLGNFVEKSSAKELFKNPLHPYTKSLLSAIPISDPAIKKQRIILKGDVPSPANPPTGCKFHTRCRYVKDICKNQIPPLIDVGNNHLVSCHRVKELN